MYLTRLKLLYVTFFPSGDPAFLRPHPRHQRAVQTRRGPPLPDRLSGALLPQIGVQVRGGLGWSGSGFGWFCCQKRHFRASLDSKVWSINGIELGREAYHVAGTQERDADFSLC